MCAHAQPARPSAGTGPHAMRRRPDVRFLFDGYARALSSNGWLPRVNGQDRGSNSHGSIQKVMAGALLIGCTR
ncbi:hypothetical protein BAU07_13860 [Bordetella flabilis]|uniref:Uncharacterized protein n=1 Tax=Bordetella flabilis TaxID=463014 RepID=A0A193GDZ0_9BORD|nr:hypothetical protein BAU07_13860 [Bordetella flabilis]